MINYIIFFILAIVAFMFVPNGGEPSAADQIRLWLKRKNREKEGAEHKGDKEFILSIINSSIDRGNKHYSEIGASRIDPYVEDVDPFSTYIFHGMCHGCARPKEDSISGCYACVGYDFYNKVSKFKGEL